MVLQLQAALPPELPLCLPLLQYPYLRKYSLPFHEAVKVVAVYMPRQSLPMVLGLEVGSGLVVREE